MGYRTASVAEPDIYLKGRIRTMYNGKGGVWCLNASDHPFTLTLPDGKTAVVPTHSEYTWPEPAQANPPEPEGPIIEGEVVR